MYVSKLIIRIVYNFYIYLFGCKVRLFVMFVMQHGML